MSTQCQRGPRWFLYKYSSDEEEVSAVAAELESNSFKIPKRPMKLFNLFKLLEGQGQVRVSMVNHTCERVEAADEKARTAYKIDCTSPLVFQLKPAKADDQKLTVNNWAGSVDIANLKQSQLLRVVVRLKPVPLKCSSFLSSSACEGAGCLQLQQCWPVLQRLEVRI